VLNVQPGFELNLNRGQLAFTARGFNMLGMKILVCIGALLTLVAPAVASSAHDPHAVAGTQPAIAVPTSLHWLPGVLLGVMWLVIAAAVIGPLIKWLDLMPKSPQLFEDEHHGHTPSAGAHASH